MSKIGMRFFKAKTIFTGSYPNLGWTPEEEEAFNAIPALDYTPAKPALVIRFYRATINAVWTSKSTINLDSPPHP